MIAHRVVCLTTRAVSYVGNCDITRVAWIVVCIIACIVARGVVCGITCSICGITCGVCGIAWSVICSVDCTEVCGVTWLVVCSIIQVATRNNWGEGCSIGSIGVIICICLGR